MNLGSLQITTALNSIVITSAANAATGATVGYVDVGAIDGLTVQFKFAYGSGGTTAKAFLQTSLDDGATWADVACAAFTTATLTKIMNVTGATAITTGATPTNGSLADNTATSGIIGPLWRAIVTTTGTYAGSTTIDVKVHAR